MSWLLMTLEGAGEETLIKDRVNKGWEMTSGFKSFQMATPIQYPRRWPPRRVGISPPLCSSPSPRTGNRPADR